MSDTPARETYTNKIERVTVEQRGPVRAVIKIEGRHRGLRSAREWLPFAVRLYFYAGSAQVRLVHSFVYDGDESRDCVCGLGVAFEVPMREDIQTRHVRFSGQGDGLWAEPIQPLKGRWPSL